MGPVPPRPGNLEKGKRGEGGKKALRDRRCKLPAFANAEAALAQGRRDAIAGALTPPPFRGRGSNIRRFQYRSDDIPPGPRYWTQLSPTEWQERYENGHTTRFRVERRIRVDGDLGITAHKLDGTSLRVFIPDRGSRKMRLRFRYDGQPGWSDLGEMTHIQ